MSHPRSYKINIGNDYVNIDHGNFSGDVDSAVNFINDFCSKNNVTFEAFPTLGDRYGKLIINNARHNVGANGIDLKSMIRWCGKVPENFIVSSANAYVTTSQNLAKGGISSLFTALSLKPSDSPNKVVNINEEPLPANSFRK